MDKIEVIDMQTWPRAEVYKLFTEQWTTITYSLNTKFSVEKTVTYLKERGLKFVPAIMWVFSREVNRHDNFRYVIKDGKLCRWDVIHPMFPTLNPQENVTFHSIRFEDDFASFYQAYLKEQQENANKSVLWATEIPENFFLFSVLPWLHFEGSAMNLKNAKGYYSPIIAVGKYNEKKQMPCLFVGNHAVADAWHVNKFFDGVQKSLDNPSEWCKI